MCGYFPIGFTTFMLNNKTLTNFTNLFSPNKFENWTFNTWVFSITIKWKKYIAFSAINNENSETLKYKVSTKH